MVSLGSAIAGEANAARATPTLSPDREVTVELPQAATARRVAITTWRGFMSAHAPECGRLDVCVIPETSFDERFAHPQAGGAVFQLCDDH
jgi:hypothetical protein